MKKRARRALAWAGILAAALAVRALPLGAAKPYMSYVDEGNYLHPAFAILRSGDWDQPAFLYPQLPIFGAAAAMHVADGLSRALGGRSLRAEVPRDVQIYDELEPFEFLLAARLAVLAVSLGIVILTGVLASRMAGPEAGLAAGLLAALVPALVVRSAYATVDPWATFFALGTLILTDVSRTSRRPGLASLGAGALAGLAFASKYPAGLVILSFMVTTILAGLPAKEKSRRVLLALSGLVVGAVVAMPALVAHPRAVFDAIVQQGTQYSELASPALWRQALVRAEWDVPYDRPELGPAFVLFATGGLLLGLRTKEIAPAIRGWWAWIGVAAALYGTRSFQPFRNMLPLVPPACVGVSLLYVRWSALSKRPRLVALAGVVWVLASFGVPVAIQSVARARLVDSRVAAIDWLAGHSRPGETGIVVRELGVLRQEIRRVPAWVGPRWARMAPDAIATHEPRWVVAGVSAGAGAVDGQLLDHPEIRDEYVVRFRAGRRATPSDPGGWRGNDEMVCVLERKNPSVSAPEQSR